MRTLVALLLLGLVLVGCSSPSRNEPSPADPPADDGALAEGLAAMYAGDNPDPDDVREGACFADELLSVTTPAQLREGGLVDSSHAVVDEIPTLDEDLAGRVADAQLACTDFIEDSTAAQVSITKGGLDRAAYAGCLRRELDADTIRAGVVASLMGAWDDSSLTRLSTAQKTCATQ